MENPWTTHPKPAPNPIASNPRLNLDCRPDLLLIRHGPERDHFRSRMHPAKGVSDEGLQAALLD